jgi:hypothetical protein
VALPPVASVTTTSGNPPVLVSDRGLLEEVGREADKALAIGKRVLTMLNVESKEIATTFNTVFDWNGGLYNPLALVTQGDTDSMRDGDSFKLKGWRGNLAFTRGTADCFVSYTFVQEGPTFITAVAQVYEFVAQAYAPLSQPSWDSRLGFRILKKGTFQLTASDPLRNEEFSFDFNHDVQYYNNSTTVYQGKVTVYITSSDSGGATAPSGRLCGQMDWVDN